MPARVLDGTKIAAAIRAELAPRIEQFTRHAGRPPQLGILLAGSDPGSEIYVRTKSRAGEALGLAVDLARLSTGASLAEARRVVERFNASDAHDGILVQAPLPSAMGAGAAAALFEAIDPRKDVDGFHPVNVGRLVQNQATLAPCTPSGIIEMLQREHIPIEGQHAVVLGRSDIVGKPMALMLLHRHATVTVCHSRTPDLPTVAAGADLLIAAVGRPAFVTREFVKAGATVVDVGITRVHDPELVASLAPPGSPRDADFQRRGSLLVGDVHPEVAGVAGALTPVPGGVGPLTVAMLMVNTVRAAQTRLADASSTR